MSIRVIPVVPFQQYFIILVVAELLLGYWQQLRIRSNLLFLLGGEVLVTVVTALHFASFLVFFFGIFAWLVGEVGWSGLVVELLPELTVKDAGVFLILLFLHFSLDFLLGECVLELVDHGLQVQVFFVKLFAGGEGRVVLVVVGAQLVLVLVGAGESVVGSGLVILRQQVARHRHTLLVGIAA